MKKKTFMKPAIKTVKMESNNIICASGFSLPSYASASGVPGVYGGIGGQAGPDIEGGQW